MVGLSFGCGVLNLGVASEAGRRVQGARPGAVRGVRGECGPGLGGGGAV